MSSTYTPVVRKKAMIGANLHPSRTPGSFTHHFGAESNNFTRKKRDIYSDSREIKEAAMRVLEKRGIVNEPNSLRDGHGGFGRFQ